MTEAWARGSKINGKHELLEYVGKGGMAEVWRGLMHGAAGFARPVALKRILPELVAAAEFVEMFVEEARVVSQLQHSNIVQVYDFDRDVDGAYFLVSEWVEGLDLGAYLRTYSAQGQRAPWPLVTAITIETLRGLAAAHERADGLGRRAAVVHRDVTPQNILLGTNGIAKLTDFGLARAMDRARRTSPGVVKGKLAYMAPEITHDAAPTPQSDVFSLAVVLWEALAGRPLYSGATDLDIFARAQRADIPPLDAVRPDLPLGLVTAVARGLAPRPEERHASARAFLLQLTRVLRGVDTPCDSYALAHSVIEACCVLGRPPPGILAAPLPPVAHPGESVPLSEEDLLALDE